VGDSVHSSSECFRSPVHKITSNLALELQRPDAQRVANDTRSAQHTFRSWSARRAALRQNIIVSTEELDRPSVHIAQLVPALRGFRTTVVVGYRPFFDYLVSYHNQLALLPLHYSPPLAAWLTVKTMAQRALQFTPAVAARYAKHFGDSVRVLPLHHLFVRDFFCDIVHASATCAEVRRVSVSEGVNRAVNPFKSAPSTCSRQMTCISAKTRAHLLNLSIAFARDVRSLPMGDDASATPLHFFSEADMITDFALHRFCSCPDAPASSRRHHKNRSLVLTPAARAAASSPATSMPANPGRLHFSHIPKTAGTSALKLLRTWESSGALLIVPDPDHNKSAAAECSLKHRPDSSTPPDSSGEKWKGVRSLAILRHPYERAVSQWQWGYHFGGRVVDWNLLGYAKTAAGMNAFIEDSIRNTTLPHRSRKTTRPRPAAPLAGPHIQDCHWLPQHKYIFDGKGRRVVDNYMCHIAYPNYTLDAQLGAYVSQLRHPRQKAGAGGHAPANAAHRIPLLQAARVQRLAEIVNPPHPCSLIKQLSAKALAALNKHFSADFNAFGFRAADASADVLVVLFTSEFNDTAGVLRQRRECTLSLPKAPRGCWEPYS